MVWWAGLTHGSSDVTGWWLSCMRRIDRLGSLSKCSPAGVNVLAGHGQGERVEVTESPEIGRAEGSVEQVEVLQMGSVRTSILGNLDPHPGPLKPRSAHLNCEDPENWIAGSTPLWAYALSMLRPLRGRHTCRHAPLVG